MNKKLFANQNSVVAANTVNNAGGKAYSKSNQEALASYVVTGCFGDTFYTKAEEQLDKVIALASECDPLFVMQAAMYSRKNALMKDMPVALLAYLAGAGRVDLVKQAFPSVVNNTTELRKFVDMIRSGKFGRKSFGSGLKNLINEFLTSQNEEKLFNGSIGTPSMKDILTLTHPKPKTTKQEALFGYFIGKDVEATKLPKLVADFELFKKKLTKEVPNVPFRFLTNCELSEKDWAKIGRDMPWNTLRMNLNMLERNGVFKDQDNIDFVAKKLADKAEVKKSSVFPYQLLTTYQTVKDGSMPKEIILALHDALEHATENVPVFPKNTYIAVDVSGSMSSPVTGYGSAQTKTKCVDAAALFASCIIRQNPLATVLPFDTRLHNVNTLNPRDSVMTNADKLSKYGGGGTACNIAFNYAVGKKVDLFVMISDNESWADYNSTERTWGSGTGSQAHWKNIKKQNPNAKLVLIDIQPSSTSQVSKDKDVLFVGGFSDNVFSVINEWYNNKGSDFVGQIQKSWST